MIALRSGPTVFAVEDRGAQLTWRRVAAGPVRIVCGPVDLMVESDGGPGAVDLDGLTPDTAYDLTVTTGDGTATSTFRTLPSPSGEELFRFATMSDLHLGATAFGVRHTMVEAPGTVDHPIRCASAALSDLTRWGARHLVVKGDVVQSNEDRSWKLAADLLGSASMPCDVLPGNHDVAHGGPDPFGVARRHGIDLVEGIEIRDLPGIRLVLMNSAIVGIDRGRWHHLVDGAAAAVATADGPAMLLVHHHPQPAPVPTHFPPGIDSITARRLLRAVHAANPAVIGSSGHTHRHRRRTEAGVPWSEVGSTKDFPGVWAGYVVHEGGIRQVVRRVSSPDCLPWLDRTRRAAGGAWGWYSPGRLSDRCFTHDWPRATPPARSAPGDTSP